MDKQDPTDDDREWQTQIHDALGHFYDQSFLIGCPLFRHWKEGRHSSVDAALRAFRRDMREAIESLRPPKQVRYGTSEWLPYEVLLHRYIHRRGQVASCEELSISRSSYYRYHKRGIDALAAILLSSSPKADTDIGARDRFRQAKSPTDAQGDVLDTARRLARISHASYVRGDELLESVYETFSPLANRRGVGSIILMSEHPGLILGDFALLRQALLGLLDVVFEITCSDTLRAEVFLQDGELAVRLQFGSCNLEGIDQLALQEGYLLAQAIYHEHGGSISHTLDDDRVTIECALPLAQRRTVLIIEDDLDAISLYQRWLQAYGISSRSLRSPEELAPVISDEPPDLILLDVLMPNWDGWAALQRLKTMPEATDIPVIICSVLSHPQLALALGAEVVLKKPIQEEELIETITKIWAREDSSDA